MAQRKYLPNDSDRVERLLEKISANRQRYIETIRDDKVSVQPSVDLGGILDFEVLGDDEDDAEEQ